jgi:hypothetical protein
MEKTIQVFHSFAEAEKANNDYYRSLSPARRVEILLELRAQWQDRKPNEASEGFKRVYRIIKRQDLADLEHL